MQGKLERGKAAFHTQSAGSSFAILAGASLIAALTLWAPDRALAACGASSHPSGVHTGVGGGVHAATSIALRGQVAAAEAEASGAQAGPAPRRCAACKLPLRESG